MSVDDGHTPLRRRVIELLSAEADGCLDVNRRRELIDMLRRDPEARTVYIEQAILHSLLFHRSRGAELANGKDGAAAGFPVGISAIDETNDPGKALPTPVNVPGGSCLAPHSPAPDFVGSLPFSYMVATVVMCVFLLSAWAYKITLSQPQVDDSAGQLALVEPPQPAFVGRITGMSDCRWTGQAAEPFLGAYVAVGSKYSLDAGLLEIAYDDGARIILEGPCEYEVDSRRSGYLAIGKLCARVEAEGGKSGYREVGASGSRENRPGTLSKKSLPCRQPAACGFAHLSNAATPSAPQHQSPVPLFAVRTPSAVVTDLGTEFGVEVDKRGRTTARVFVGSVRLESATTDGAVRAAQVLSAGQIGMASAVGEVAVSASAGGTAAFTRLLPSLREARRAEADAYAKLVMSLGPVAYYRMERPEEEKDILTVFDSTPAGRHGKLSIIGGAGGSERLWCMGRFGGALRFRGEFFGDYVIAPRTPDSDSNQLSASAWLFVDDRGFYSQIVGEGGSRNNCRLKITMLRYDQVFLGCVAPKQGEICILHNTGSNEEVALKRWYHLALVADGSNAHLFLDGVEVQTKSCDGVLASPPGGYLLLGCDNLDHDPTKLSPASFWSGRVDEFAIFHRALNTEEIQQLYKGPLARSGTADQVESSIFGADKPVSLQNFNHSTRKALNQ